MTAGLVLCVMTPATAAEAPSLTRTTTVAGVATPEALTTGEWTSAGGVWSLDLGSVTPIGGETMVRAAWRSPWFTARAGRTVFVSRIDVGQEPVPGGYEYVNEFRMCTSRTCYDWDGEVNDALPAVIAPSTLPYRVEFGHGVSLEWRDRPMRLRIEWRYRQTQHDGNVARTRFRLAVGAAASSL